MKISGQIQGVPPIYKTQKTENTSKFKEAYSNKITPKDEVVISNEGKDYQLVMKALKNVPDIRNEKIASVDLSTYKADSNKTAEKFIKEMKSFWEKDM